MRPSAARFIRVAKGVLVSEGGRSRIAEKIGERALRGWVNRVESSLYLHTSYRQQYASPDRSLFNSINENALSAEVESRLTSLQLEFDARLASLQSQIDSFQSQFSDLRAATLPNSSLIALDAGLTTFSLACILIILRDKPGEISAVAIDIMYKNDMIKRTHVPGVPFPSASASNMDVLRYASELLAPRRPGEPAVRQRTAEDRAKDPAGADNTRATLAQMLCITRMQAEGDTVAGAGLDDQWDQLRALWKIVDPKGEGSLDVEDLSEADRNIILHTASDVANEDAPAESPH